jgi:hypothetical protein
MYGLEDLDVAEALRALRTICADDDDGCQCSGCLALARLDGASGGIPYAPYGFVSSVDMADGRVGTNWFALCPKCARLIPLRERKDEESFTKREYRKHYEAEHGGGVR